MPATMRLFLVVSLVLLTLISTLGHVVTTTPAPAPTGYLHPAPGPAPLSKSIPAPAPVQVHAFAPTPGRDYPQGPAPVPMPAQTPRGAYGVTLLPSNHIYGSIDALNHDIELVSTENVDFHTRSEAEDRLKVLFDLDSAPPSATVQQRLLALSKMGRPVRPDPQVLRIARSMMKCYILCDTEFSSINDRSYHSADEILPGVWLGSKCAGENPLFMKQFNIKHVYLDAHPRQYGYQPPLPGVTVRYQDDTFGSILYELLLNSKWDVLGTVYASLKHDEAMFIYIPDPGTLASPAVVRFVANRLGVNEREACRFISMKRPRVRCPDDDTRHEDLKR